MKITLALLFVCAFTLGVAAQGSRYPNELEAYRFFGKGKLQNLNVIDSSKEDAAKIFGNDCEKKCGYDDNWFVVFEYYDALWSTTRIENGQKVDYVLDSKYLNKLRSIELRPKKPVELDNFEFPAILQHLSEVSNVEYRNGGGNEFMREMFQDDLGLTYKVDTKTNYENDRAGSNKPITGQLVSIRYALPDAVQKSLFVLRK